MKLFLALVVFAAAVPAAVNPQLQQVNTVYILAMGNSMDQFLANRLTAAGVFQVVTDPKKADAIITDRLGEAFETKFNDLYPPPAAAAPPKEDKDKDKDKAGKSMDMTGGSNGRLGGFSRSRGNVFIVDRKSRNVVWSTYEPPKDSSANELSKTADKIVKHLKFDLTGQAEDRK